MNKSWKHRSLLLIIVLFGLSGMILANTRFEDDVWTRVNKEQLQKPGIDSSVMPTNYETFRLNKAALRALLDRAPEEYSGGREIVLSMPMPDGTFSRFRIEHSLVVERGLLKEYPELGATYRGQGIDDPAATARFDFLPNGFHSLILSPNGTVLVNPYSSGDTDNYISFFKRDQPKVGTFECEVKTDGVDRSFEEVIKPRHPEDNGFLPNESAPEVLSGTQLRTYRLALAADNEYCVAVGGNTIAGSLAAEVLIMNRVNGVYERDLAIHMNIIANNNLITYAGNNMSCGGSCNSGNDPYTNDDGSAMLGQNQSTLTSVIGSANYDIGHVFSTGGGGIASLNSPCSSFKAQGVTGLGTPLGDAFAIDYVAHEMGHQFGANHTFNSVTGSCSGNRASSAAFEPGSGITIMGYAGICDNQDLAQHSIDTFHVKSIEEIIAFSQSGGGNSCASTTSSGNTLPVVTGPGNFTIPKNSAFALTASATDANGDTLTYDWEEYDLGGSTTAVPNSDSDGAKPILRPYSPTTNGTRFFPSLSYILNNANVPPSTYDCGRGGGNPCLLGELLPSIARTMLFKVVVRDNRSGTGGVNSNTTSTITVDGASGPFAVTAPNTAVSWTGNSTQTVTWNVANTSSAPVSAANVKISFSSDGGNTFPTVLAASTANDGSQTVTIPNTPTTTARIKVEAVGNIFFDISNTNFTVTLGNTPTNTATPTPTSTPTAANTPTNTATNTATPTPTGSPVTVALPLVSASPGETLTIPVTVGDLTDRAVISYDFQVSYDPEVLLPLSPAYDITGTLSSSSLITPNADNSGHLIISAFQAVPLEGAGTLINLRFVVLGLNGQSTSLTFEDYTDPNTVFHPGFQFNEGIPASAPTNGSVTIGAVTISGTVTYGNASAPPKYISNATVCSTGSSTVCTVTDAPGPTAGQYTLIPSGPGDHIASVTKTTGQNSITSNDAARIAQHVAGTLLLTTDNQKVTADVSNNGSISSNDAALIARYVTSLGPPYGITGTWRFFIPPGPTFPAGAWPTTLTCSAGTSNCPNFNFVGLLEGEVTGNWTPSAARPVSSGPGRSTTVELPNVTAPSDKEVVIPVNINNAANKDIISYEFDLKYDPTVIQPQAEPVDVKGTVSRGLTVVANAQEPGILRVAIYGPMPIDKNGLLLNLRFTAVGAPGAVSPLIWERLMINEGEPQAITSDGRVELF